MTGAGWTCAAVTAASLAVAVRVCGPYGSVPAVAWLWGAGLAAVCAGFGAWLWRQDVRERGGG